MEVRGSTTPEFARVREVLARADLGGGGAAFSAYVQGEKVVDLWAGETEPGRAWAEDTLTTAMSATKGFAALCIQILYDRGEIDLDAPVARYWPEYAQAGKEGTLVRHVMTHTAGMLCFSSPSTLLDWTGRGWDDYDGIARAIAASPPAWQPGTRIGYHAISIGWLQQELVRRITGMTLGEFFAREVAEPLGLDIWIGTPESEHPRIAPVVAEQPDTSSLKARVLMAIVRRMASNPASPMGQAYVPLDQGNLSRHFDFFNLSEVRALQIPAANGSADARSVARMYAMLAGGGQLGGRRVVSSASIERFRTPAFTGPNALIPTRGLWKLLKMPPTTYAIGYEGAFSETPPAARFGPTPASFGHLGAGGQIGFADPDRQIGIGFLRNHHADWTVSTELITAVYGCIGDSA